MIYIADKNSAFASYSTEELAEKAVRLLPDNGYNGQNIRVLLPTNQSTRTFAQGMQIEVPAGVADDPTADLALDGASGFLNMFHDSHSKSFTDCIARYGGPSRLVRFFVLGAISGVVRKKRGGDDPCGFGELAEHSDYCEVDSTRNPDGSWPRVFFSEDKRGLAR